MVNFVGSSEKDAPEQVDPLRRVFVPVMKRDVNGDLVFKTTDGQRYRQGSDGVRYSVFQKTNGKLARKLRVAARKDAQGR